MNEIIDYKGTSQLVTRSTRHTETRVDRTEFCHRDELTVLCLPICHGKISCRLPIVVPGVIVSGYVSK